MTPIVIGRLRLKDRQKFTQYGEHAAWTDYVTCEPQSVDLKYDGSYWVFGSFAGVLTASTYPSGARSIGQPAKALVQTQAWGGIGNWDGMYSIEITDPRFAIKQVSQYSDGRPMLALRRVCPACGNIFHPEHGRCEQCLHNPSEQSAIAKAGSEVQS